MTGNKSSWIAPLFGSALLTALFCTPTQALVWTLPNGGYIPPNALSGGTSGVSLFTITVTGEAPILSALQVRLAIQHTFVSDLKVILESPTGTQIVLVQNKGLSGENFQDTLFDDTASIFIGNGVAPFIGTFKPEPGINNTLSTFYNENPNGNWILRVSDDGPGDSGYLFGASNDISVPWGQSVGTTLYITSTNPPDNGGGPNTGVVPEPLTASLSLIATGALATALLRRRQA